MEPSRMVYFVIVRCCVREDVCCLHLAHWQGLVCTAISAFGEWEEVIRREMFLQEPWEGAWCRVGMPPSWGWYTPECGIELKDALSYQNRSREGWTRWTVKRVFPGLACFIYNSVCL